MTHLSAGISVRGIGAWQGKSTSQSSYRRHGSIRLENIEWDLKASYLIWKENGQLIGKTSFNAGSESCWTDTKARLVLIWWGYCSLTKIQWLRYIKWRLTTLRRFGVLVLSPEFLNFPGRALTLFFFQALLQTLTRLLISQDEFSLTRRES